MKHFAKSVMIIACVNLFGATSYADEKTVSAQSCEIEHFIGTGETMDLSFSVCKNVVGSKTFVDNFSMDCQQGLVTYHMKVRPSAKYLRIGSDGNPVHCSST